MKIMMDYQIFFLQKYGGVSRYFMELSDKLIKNADTKVGIPILFSNNYYLNKSGRRCIDVDKHKFWGIVDLYKLNQKYSNFCIKKGNYDVIHSTWIDPYIGKIASDRFVVTIHDMIHEIYFQGCEEIESKKKSIYESAAIIAISENTKRDICKFYPDINPEKIRVIYHGTNHLPPATKPVEYDMPCEYVLYVGRRDSYKGATTLFNAIPEVMKEHKNIMFVFAGGETFNQNETELIKELGVENNVFHCVPSDSELAYIYSNAICYVNPSEYEGFGFPLLEAFDNKCPVVCTDSSSFPEVAGDAALYFKVGNSSELSRKILEFIEKQEVREEYIKKGLNRVSFFSWEKTAEETLKLYQDVVTRNDAVGKIY